MVHFFVISNPLTKDNLRFTSIPAALDAPIVGGIHLRGAVRTVDIHEEELDRL